MSAHLSLEVRVQQALASGWSDNRICQTYGVGNGFIKKQRDVIDDAHRGDDATHRQTRSRPPSRVLRGVPEVKSCGTEAAYRRHMRANERCGRCSDAARFAAAERRVRARTR